MQSALFFFSMYIDFSPIMFCRRWRRIGLEAGSRLGQPERAGWVRKEVCHSLAGLYVDFFLFYHTRI